MVSNHIYFKSKTRHFAYIICDLENNQSISICSDGKDYIVMGETKLDWVRYYRTILGEELTAEEAYSLGPSPRIQLTPSASWTIDDD